MAEPLMPQRTKARYLRSTRALVGAVVLVCVLVMALLASWLAPYDPLAQDLALRRQPPTREHPFGMDELGRDNLSRVLYGARLSLRLGIASVALAAAAGTVLGAVAGYCGGWVDGLIVSLVDLIMAFPTLLLAIAIVTMLGRGLTNVMYAVAFTAIPTYARLVRVSVLVTKEREYVLAAGAIGATPLCALARHILPACLSPLLTQAMLGIGTAILETAGLSFLGLGARPPTPEWGAMIGQGRGAVFAAPHIVLYPGLAIMLTVLGFNLLGDGLRDANVRS